jgi:hypothetical protein
MASRSLGGPAKRRKSLQSSCPAGRWRPGAGAALPCGCRMADVLSACAAPQHERQLLEVEIVCECGECVERRLSDEHRRMWCGAKCGVVPDPAQRTRRPGSRNQEPVLLPRKALGARRCAHAPAPRMRAL